MLGIIPTFWTDSDHIYIGPNWMWNRIDDWHNNYSCTICAFFDEDLLVTRYVTWSRHERKFQHRKLHSDCFLQSWFDNPLVKNIRSLDLRLQLARAFYRCTLGSWSSNLLLHGFSSSSVNRVQQTYCLPISLLSQLQMWGIKRSFVTQRWFLQCNKWDEQEPIWSIIG